ncbi:MAG: thiol-disulfide oxidoreductase DCC family protein [Sandaracinaceae bacterium]
MPRTVRIATDRPLERAVVLYDGHCVFCKSQMKNLVTLAKRHAFDALSFQDPGVLDRFEGLTYEECMEEMKLILPDGRVFGGMEAAVRAVTTRPVLGLLAWLYYVPGVRWLMDFAYRQIAKRRYRIAGKALAAGDVECENGTCALHFDLDERAAQKERAALDASS